jgi:hypothetical protein
LWRSTTPGPPFVGVLSQMARAGLARRRLDDRTPRPYPRPRLATARLSLPRWREVFRIRRQLPLLGGHQISVPAHQMKCPDRLGPARPGSPGKSSGIPPSAERPAPPHGAHSTPCAQTEQVAYSRRQNLHRSWPAITLVTNGMKL